MKLKSEEETEINGMGPDIRPEDVEALFEKAEPFRERGCAGAFRKHTGCCGK